MRTYPTIYIQSPGGPRYMTEADLADETSRAGVDLFTQGATNGHICGCISLNPYGPGWRICGAELGVVFYMDGPYPTREAALQTLVDRLCS